MRLQKLKHEITENICFKKEIKALSDSELHCNFERLLKSLNHVFDLDGTSDDFEVGLEIQAKIESLFLRHPEICASLLHKANESRKMFLLSPFVLPSSSKSP